MRSLIRATLLTLLLAAPSAAQAPAAAPPPSVELPPELRRVLTEYEYAWGARDAAALAGLFHPDAFVMAPGRPPERGPAAVERYYQGRGGPLALRALAWAAEDSVGYIIGGYAAAPGLRDAGKFTLTLRRGAEGRWLIVTDMDNANHGREP